MSETPDDPETMRAAIAAVRREGYKVALLYALVDGAVATVGGNLLAEVAGAEALAADAGLTPPLGADAALWIALLLGLSVAVGEFALRVRRPLVERFEAANPSVHEALRTARDAVESGRDTPMARALYADVIEGLREASSRDLLSTRRLALSLVVLLGLGVLSVGTTAVGVDLRAVDGGPGEGGTDATTPIGTPAAGDLTSGESVLGEAETVTAGSENLSALVDAGGGTGSGGGDRAYDRSGLSSGDGAIDPQRAGFDGGEEFENAELIKEYTLRVRENESE